MSINLCNRLLAACFPSSVRRLILLLSFGVLSSLFANLQLFNLVVLYTEHSQHRLLLPDELGGISAHTQPSVNWATPFPSSTLSSSTASISNATAVETSTPFNISSPEPVIVRNEKPKAEAQHSLYVDQGYEDDKDIDDDRGWFNETAKRRKKIHGSLKKSVKARNPREAYAEPADYDTDGDVEEFNPEQQAESREFGFDNGKLQRLAQSLLFSAPGMVILIAHFPCYVLVRRYGSQKLMLAALVLSSAITALFPFILELDSSLALIMLGRLLLALCVAPAFSFLGQMAANWATVGEQLFFVLIGFMSIQFGPILSWFFTTTMLKFGDNSSRFYVFALHSVAALALAVLWAILYRDQPQKHQLVNGEELNYIVKGKPRTGRPPRLPTSLFCLLLRSTSAWACWMASFCYFFAQLTLLVFYPIFLHKVLRQTIDKTVVKPLALLFVTHLLSHIFASFVRRSQSATWKVRLFNSLAFVLSALLFLGLAILPRNNELNAARRLWLLWFCLFPLGLTSLGFIKSMAVTGGGYFTQYIVSHMQLAFGLAYALVPTLLYSSMPTLVQEHSIVHWRLLFLSAALVLLLGMAIFVILGRGTPTSWAEQWAEEAQGDAPLLHIKFSPIHQPTATIPPLSVEQ